MVNFRWHILQFAVFVSLGASVHAADEVFVPYLTSNPPAVYDRLAENLREMINAEWALKESKALKLRVVVFPFKLSENETARTENERVISEILTQKPAVIFAPGASSALMSAKLTSIVPIVIGCRCNPGPTSKSWRIIENLCAPEKNITGFTRYDLRFLSADSSGDFCNQSSSRSLISIENLNTQRLQILRDSREPPITRIGLLYGDDYDEKKWQYQRKAREAGITLVPIKLNKQTIRQAAALMQEQNVDAGLIFSDELLRNNTREYIEATRGGSKPTMFPWDEADSGAWMHYGTKVDLAKEAASYIVPILQGKPIRELPVSFPKEYELVVNHKLAKEHGWVFPKKFLLYPQREPKPQ
jgi:ABC-type uncharacterized transport system substrate-binding protein